MSEAVHLKNITKRFPGVVANDSIDLRVESGSVHALLGENGAGKTTLMNVLYGLYEADGGEIHVDGQHRDFSSPRDAIDAGIGMIHQHFMLVDTMTVAENIVLGQEPRKWGGLAVDHDAARRQVEELSDRFGFAVDPRGRIEEVGVGVRQRVEILKTLYRGADILILDEPTAVLTPQEVKELFDVFEELTANGKTIIFITHKLGEAMEAADEITVLRDGEAIDTVDADTTSRAELARWMVGREVVLDVEAEEGNPAETVLSVDDLHVTDGDGVDRLAGVDFDVREGEIFGVAGVDGNGQAQLVEAVTGLGDVADGAIQFRGDDVTNTSRHERIESGMAYIPEDRQTRGLVMDFDLVENGLLGSQHSAAFTAGGRIDWEAVREHTEDIVEIYDIRPPNTDTDARSLSGGNQQKFVVGREFERDPEIVVAAHPTRGVDIGSTEFIHERLLELRDEGKAVLLVSSKLDEVQQLSDRLAVISGGEFTAVVDPDDVTEEEIGLYMGGEREQPAADGGK